MVCYFVIDRDQLKLHREPTECHLGVVNHSQCAIPGGLSFWINTDAGHARVDQLGKGRNVGWILVAARGRIYYCTPTSISGKEFVRGKGFVRRSILVNGDYKSVF